MLGAVLAAGLASFSTNPNALINAEARSAIAPAELAALQGALEGTLRTIFWSSAGVVAVALLFATTLPGGKIGGAEVHEGAGERLVVAEMTNIDAAHEPEG